MYVARFEIEAAGFVASAFQWPVSGATVLPALWRDELLKHPDVEFGFRIYFKGKTIRATLFLCADTRDETKLHEVLESLLARHSPVGLVVPQSIREFDEMAGDLPRCQIRVNQGYSHGEFSLACDFRLYTYCNIQRAQMDFVYHLHLRTHNPDAELKRKVLKYVAWLDLEEPFTAKVRETQQQLALRLLEHGWIGEEFVAVSEDQAHKRLQTEIHTHFGRTTGEIGFTEPPIEPGDFTELLRFGCHPGRLATKSIELTGLASLLFKKSELEWILSSGFNLETEDRQTDGSNERKYDVFISYASGDAAHAVAVCHHLEDNGLQCWIAPRNINRDIRPYTEAIEMGISRSRAVVVLISATANLSVHIPRELDLALERRLSIVPVRLQNVLPAGQLNFLLRTCQWLDAYEMDFRNSMDELLSRLKFLGN